MPHRIRSTRNGAPSGALFFARIAIPVLAASLALAPAPAAAECPAEPPPLPEVAITPPPAVALPVQRRATPLEWGHDGTLQIGELAAAPTTVNPTLRAGFAADAAQPRCWRVARIELRIVVTEAHLVVPAAFPPGGCLDRGARAVAQAMHGDVVQAQQEFWRNSAGRLAQVAHGFGWAAAPDAREAGRAFNTWIIDRQPTLRALAQSFAASFVPALPDLAVAEQACPAFREELRRFAEAEQAARPGPGN